MIELMISCGVLAIDEIIILDKRINGVKSANYICVKINVDGFDDSRARNIYLYYNF